MFANQNNQFHTLFERIVNKKPDSIAVKYLHQELSYKDLNNLSNIVARNLIKFNSIVGTRIGVIMPRSHYTIASIMGILKTGSVYVPIDASYPTSHINYIIEDSNLDSVITLSDCLHMIPERLYTQTILIDEINFISTFAENPNISLDINRPFLQIYTSGSTGKPKGIIHNEKEHFVRFNWLWKEFEFNDREVVGQRTSVGFLPSIWELLGGLLAGIKTIIIPDNYVKNPLELCKLIKNEKITRISLVPYLLKSLIISNVNLKDYLSTIRWISIAGAPLTIDLYKSLRSSTKSAVILNEYGTTEANGITYYNTEQSNPEQIETMPIGFPIPGVTLYVLDENLNKVTGGNIGQLYVTTDSTGKNYVGKASNIVDKFLPDPFSDANGTMFATGDIVHYLDDQSIEYIGRSDNQLKIRDTRIEPEQIESILTDHPIIDMVIVSGWCPDGETNKGLIAYIESSFSKLDITELRRYSLKHLPAHMIPTIWKKIDKLPTTPNGKIDRKTLFKNIRSNISKPDIKTAKSNLLDYIIQSIIYALELSAEEVTKNTMLSDLGIDSLTTVELVVLWEQALDIKIPISGVLSRSTINDLVIYLNNLENNTSSSISIKQLLNEAELFDNYLPNTDLTYNPHSEQVSNILITGATGFLGVHMLVELLSKPNIKVHCLIRCKDKDNGLTRLSTTLKTYGLNTNILDKVNILCGDLSQNNFGLSDDIYAELSNSISNIYHAGASVHHLRSYEDLKSPNVQGTAEIIKFSCQSRIKKLIFISTIAVNPLERGLPSYGYAESKFVAEKLLEKASKHGLPVSIIRCGNISSSTNLNAGRDDVVIRDCLRFFSSLSVKPRWNNSVVDIIPVDIASQALISIGLSNDLNLYKKWQFTHPRPLSLNTSLEFLNSDITNYKDYNNWLSISQAELQNTSDLWKRALISFFDDTFGKPLFNEYFEAVDILLPELSNHLENHGHKIFDINKNYLKLFVF